MLYNPQTMHGSKFWGQLSKQYTIIENLNTELMDKYLFDYSSHIKAKAEIGSVTHCFDKCVTDVSYSAGLNPDEKNCMRECYMKRVLAKDDMFMMVEQ